MKSTAIAPANIAFVKYWGRKDAANTLPYHGSISMTLDNCLTTTTAEFRSDLGADEVVIQESNGNYRELFAENGDKDAQVFQHIERIRKLAGISDHVKIVSQNSFPSSAGIASSASGFAALTLALVQAAILTEGANSNSRLQNGFETKTAPSPLRAILKNTQELSRLTRLGGSASAMRSIHGGFVETVVEKDDCYAQQIAPEGHWSLVDIIAVVDEKKKSVSSSTGHERAPSSNSFPARLQQVPQRLDTCREAITTKNFSLLGECSEADTLSMHMVAMTSQPTICYWTPATLRIMEAVWQWRDEGLEAYFSIDAGANVHVFCEGKNVAEVQKRIESIPAVQYTIISRPGRGAHTSSDHLF